ncbi:MAG TPA: MMPL family transporter [Acidimicrobiales bacterium]|nr:MMPL family transporter [Acidimicrobiales bacterium]
MRALATWCFRHRRLVLTGWIGLLILVSLVSNVVGTKYSNNFQLPNTASTQALKLLLANTPKLAGDNEQVVFQTSGGLTITSPSVEAAINADLAKLIALPYATRVVSPFGPLGGQQISADKTVAFATLTFDKQAQSLPQAEAARMVSTAASADMPGLRAAVSGQLAGEATRPGIGGSFLGIVLAGVVLLLFFGSVFAMALPLLSALLALGTAIGLVTMLSHALGMPQFAPELVILIGLGVGVDYALFIVTRYRQGLIAGRSTEEAAVGAVNTSGRAVLFAGMVVCIALMGMFALGVTFLYGLAVAASIGVLLTMISALTLLPAMLGFIGPRILSRKQKRDLAANGPRIVGAGSTGFWPRWASFVQRRPAVPAVIALVVIGTIILPFFSLRLGSSDEGNDPVGTTTRTAYDMLAQGFGPGFNGPLMLVAESPGRSHLPPGAGSVANPLNFVLTKLSVDLKAQPDVAQVAAPLVLPAKSGGEIALLNVYPKGSPQDASTGALISHLRSAVIPAALAGTGVSVYVGGSTAIFVDFAHVLTGKLPLFIGLVVLLSFLLLSVVFRSLAVPLTGAVMNLLSIGGAFGLLTAVFEWGWLGNLFGVNRPGPIEAFLPVMLFSILFGLSMDYQVFLVTRIHEEYLKSGDNHMAVRNGLAATGKTITAAAVIMILVFGSFILGGQRVIKEFGVGLGGGILIDAVIIRMTIVPAVMQLIGKANWWFPASLDRRLPRLSVDPALEPDSAPGVAPGPAPAPALAAGGSGS